MNRCGYLTLSVDGRLEVLVGRIERSGRRGTARCCSCCCAAAETAATADATAWV